LRSCGPLRSRRAGNWHTVVAIGSIIGLNYLWKLPIVATIKANPGHTAILVGSYFALGIGWSFIKWVLFLHKQNFKYRDFKTQFLSKNNAKELTPELAAALMEKLDEHNKYESYPNERISATPPQFGPGGLKPSLSGRLGCEDPLNIHLTPEQQTTCYNHMAQLLREAKPLGLNISDKKKADYDRYVHCGDVYRHAGVPGSNAADESTGSIPGLGYNPSFKECPPADK
jgi:hypothetical protein